MSAIPAEPPPFVGLDGFAMLALSVLVMLASGGLTVLVALAHVVRVGLAAQADAADSHRIIVLGYRLRRGRYLDTVYRQRLDRALVLLRRTPTVEAFLLGSRRHPDQPSEAEAGAAYLCVAGVAASRLHQEDRSRHTLENLRHYRTTFGAGADGRTTLISSRFHLARATLMAAGLALHPVPCAAEADPATTLRRPDRLVTEALLLHWYVVGRCFAHWTGHRRMLARIS